MHFILAVLNDRILFKQQTKKQVIAQMYTAEVPIQGDDAERLLRINIMSLTDEMVRSLDKEIKEAQKDLKFWDKTTPKKQFLSDLEDL